MKRLLIFDDDNVYINELIVQNGYTPKPNEYLAELNENITFHRPKLVDGQLVEGKTEDEFFMDELISSLKPSQSELEAAEFEIQILTLLFEMEVI